MDAAALKGDPGLARDWPAFWEDLEADGEIVMGMLGLAKHQAALEAMKALKGPEHATYPLLRARLSSPPERLMTPISDMRTSLYGQTVSVRVHSIDEGKEQLYFTNQDVYNLPLTQLGDVPAAVGLLLYSAFHLLVVDVAFVLFWTQSACIVPKQNTRNIYHNQMNNRVFVLVTM